MPEPESKALLRESVKIRHYIMNLIYRHPNEKMLIPGSNELAAMFGVGRATVTRVLKSLTEEGYLEGRRGIGTFTLHQNFIPVENEMPPLIGLLAGDGKYFYYPHQVWGIMASCGLVLTRGGCNVRPLSLTGADDETRFAEISRQYLDGLVVLDVNPERIGLIRRLRDEAGLKAVIQVSCRFDADLSGVDSFCFDFYRAGVEVGARLLAEGRTALWFVFLNPVTRVLLDGIRSAYASAGKSLAVKSFTWETPDVFEEIRSALRDGAPDALYVHSEHWAALRGILDAAGVETDRRCRLIAESHAVRGTYHGILLDIPFEELGDEIGTRMMELFGSGPADPVARRMPIRILERNE